ncbi:MAG: BON domain-containing protein, partial [Pyrinomonadaceae bacterium]
MITRSIARTFTVFCFFAFAITIGAIARPAFAQCEKVADSQIVASIYAKIKNDKVLAPQISHINVVSVFAAVKFQGWADKRADYDRIVGFASETSCVRLVNVNNFAETPPASGNALRAGSGCSAGTKPCGDVCIPEGDPCNIGEFSLYTPVILFDLDRSFNPPKA